jgi:DNA-directed RNA polymerase specialized sigma24 family protein
MDPTPAVRPEELLAHADWLRRLARSLVGEGQADDLVQDTWVAALRRPPHAVGSPRPWLARVLANAARNRRRGELRRSAREELAMASPEPPADPARIAVELDGQRRLLAAV